MILLLYVPLTTHLIIGAPVLCTRRCKGADMGSSLHLGALPDSLGCEAEAAERNNNEGEVYSLTRVRKVLIFWFFFHYREVFKLLPAASSANAVAPAASLGSLFFCRVTQGKSGGGLEWGAAPSTLRT